MPTYRVKRHHPCPLARPVLPQPPGSSLTPAERAAILALSAAGQSVKEIRGAIGRSDRTVRDVLAAGNREEIDGHQAADLGGE